MSISEEVPWAAVHRALGLSVPPIDDTPVGVFVERYAQTMPDKPALRFFGKNINYSELNALANRMANALVALGVSREDVIGINLSNIPQYFVVLIAISKLGCAGSGISPLLAPPEVAAQIETAGITVLITLEELIDKSLAVLKALPSCLKTVLVTSTHDQLTPPALGKCPPVNLEKLSPAVITS